MTGIRRTYDPLLGRQVLHDHSYKELVDRADQPVSNMLYVSTTTPAAITNSTTETSFGPSCKIPANSLQVGDVIRVSLKGFYSTAAIAPNITGRVKFNGTGITDTGAITTVAGATNKGWNGTGDYVVRAIGASGTLMGNAELQISTTLTAALMILIPNTIEVGFDSTIDQFVTVTAQWSTASASNSISLAEMMIERLRIYA